MSDPAFKPDEDANTIFQEDTWLQGSLIMCIAYGAVATLSIQCFFMLIRGTRRSKWLRDIPLLAFVISIFMLSTIFIGTAMQFTQQAFVDQRNFPGGPAAYEVVEFSLPIDSVANCWRCTVIYKNSSLPAWVSVGLASIFWLVEFILGSLFLGQIMSTSPWGAVNFTLGFWCFSLALNIIATFLIVGRLLFYRRRLAHIVGKGHGEQFTGLIAMVVESELMYTAFLILFIVPFILNHPLENVFIQGIALVQATAALMIVYRVAGGQGWTAETYVQVTTRMGSNPQLAGVSSTLRGPSAGAVAEAEGKTSTSGSGISANRDMYVSKEEV
ncbi:hypothetical protein PHLCEN_2v11531 [Hermanssonia centrifuga]|uniref:Uncharacterized protein n=1 Tax=Hermanssonia centrifuga TaxID=98765 RepID=A0A2R6NJQ1_9APHY|nr:hypothetical protein PHLCEN_2v11531 [Hermanssonia centrifuga]